jgi:hypothetical protein
MMPGGINDDDAAVARLVADFDRKQKTERGGGRENIFPPEDHECKTMPSLIVCGWFTPDYAHWADRLISSLDTAGVRHDIVAVPKLSGGWERNTCRKAGYLLEAMDRHPGEVIVFLDVDCVVRGDLSALTEIGGDVAFRLAARIKLGRARMQPRSGTVVVKPTPAARAFVEKWKHFSAIASYGDIDESTLAQAMETSPGVTISPLPYHWCAMESCAANEIVHDTASKNTYKASHKMRRLVRAWSWLKRRSISAANKLFDNGDRNDLFWS